MLRPRPYLRGLQAYHIQLEEREFMEKDRKNRLIFAGLALLVLIACGVIGYLNRSGTGLSDQSKTQTAAPGGTLAGELTFCSGSHSLCVNSFGMDNAGNMLIVLMYAPSPSTEMYAKITLNGTENLYPCQKIEFSPDTYYCLGNPVPNSSTVTLQVYTKSDNMLLASGDLPVQFNGTPVAVAATRTPSATATAAPTGLATTTALPTAIAATPVANTAYPNPPTAYPNSTHSRSYP